LHRLRQSFLDWHSTADNGRLGQPALRPIQAVQLRAGAHPIVQRARDLKLEQIHPDVDHVLSQSRKIDKIASSDVARSRVDWNTFHTTIK
jgi:hypothetical protein